MRIYIASAYTKGDAALNVRRVIEVADELLWRGHIPYVPHLTHLWHLISPKSPSCWYDYDNSFIDHWAEGLLRLDNDSIGADNEVVRALKLGLPVYYNIKEIPQG